jgi:hypothetical protein
MKPEDVVQDQEHAKLLSGIREHSG